MKTRVTRRFLLTVAAALLCAGTALRAEVPPLSDSLRRAYDFKGAVAWCERMMKVVDSTRTEALEQELILSQNGLSMTRYCSRPEVVARYRFSLDDFFLSYPMENRAWRAVPNPLDSLGGDPLVRAMYVPQGAEDIYYSARDADGIRNLYHTALRDSVWTVPQLINEDLTSSSDEIYPVVTPDGKTLYFASKGLYGMGGYDLYVSQWNENTRDWDAPVNLGFPYSSPFDDFLLAPSEDGQYTVFASNRDCPADSVWVYVLAFDSMPVRTEVSTVDGLKALCSLTPQDDRRGNPAPAIQGIPVSDAKQVERLRGAVITEQPGLAGPGIRIYLSGPYQTVLFSGHRNLCRERQQGERPLADQDHGAGPVRARSHEQVGIFPNPASRQG